MTERMSNAAAEREAARNALKNGSLHDRDTYTAKQIAVRCGTDAKTMRKFFRSNHSTVEPVGQGGRYEFDAKDLPKIKKEFDSWCNRSSLKKRPLQQAVTKQKKEREAPTPTPEVEEPDYCEGCEAKGRELNEKGYCQQCIMAAIKAGHHAMVGLPEPEGPSEDELKELEDLDLDLDDLDAEDD